MIQLTDNVFAIPMPKGAESCELRGAHSERPYPLLSFYGEGEAVELPPGDYEILVFNTGTASEEDARKVVGSSEWYFPTRHTRYIDYSKPYNSHNRQEWSAGFSGPRDSLASLLRSKGCEGNWAVIQKIKQCNQ